MQGVGLEEAQECKINSPESYELKGCEHRILSRVISKQVEFVVRQKRQGFEVRKARYKCHFLCACQVLSLC